MNYVIIAYICGLVAMRAQPSSSADSKKNKVGSLVQLDKLEKNDRDTGKDK